MKKLIIITSVFFIAITSCHKQTASGNTNIAEFPNEVGNHWRYIRHPGTQYSQPIDVDIIGTRVLPNGEFSKVWLYKSLSGHTDTGFVVSVNQVVKIYKYSFGYYEEKRYLLPVTTGNVWTIPQNYRDTTKVLSNHGITVLAGTFDNTFELLHTRASIVNTYTNDTIWFTPKVGMTKLNQLQLDLGPAPGNGLWELSSYSLK